MKPEVVLESVPCPNGCGAGTEELFRARDRLFGLPGEYAVVRCATCGLLRTDPRPTPETIGYYYPEAEYCAYQPSAVSGCDSRNASQRFQKLAVTWCVLRGAYQKIVQRNTHVLPDLSPGRMLEIGCASGSYLSAMAEKGWCVQGIEMSRRMAMCARAAGHEVFCGALESAPDPAEHFDLIVGWMVVEHLHAPALSLRRLAGWGKPGCWLAISVPNASQLQLRLFKERWFGLQVPTHLYHFSVASLKTLLARSGWRMERVFHQRCLANYSRSLSYVLEDLGAPKWLSMLPRRVLDERVLYPISCLLAALRQTGLVTVWARKSSGSE